METAEFCWFCQDRAFRFRERDLFHVRTERALFDDLSRPQAEGTDWQREAVPDTVWGAVEEDQGAVAGCEWGCGKEIAPRVQDGEG